MTCLELNIKYWTSTDLNSMRWLGLFTNKTFRKHLKLNFPHRDFMLCIVSLAIFHPHFVIHIFSSAFHQPHFSIRILSSAFFYPPSAAIRSALYRDLYFGSCEEISGHSKHSVPTERTTSYISEKFALKSRRSCRTSHRIWKKFNLPIF